MTSRDAILQRIGQRLAGGPGAEPLQRVEVWPDSQTDVETLARRFTDELEGVSGEVIRCSSIDDARTTLAELVAAAGWRSIAAADAPLVRGVLDGFGPERVVYPEPNSPPARLAEIPAALIPAEYLLADTGSCVVRAVTAEARLLAYLPEASVIVARTEQLREHMPAAWGEMAARLREPDVRGEWVVISGPSRTADIEKILILGVHGPRRLVVLMID